ncbi:MAG: carbamoyltransferase [Candidatus Hydrogenedentota bacterium]
MSTSNRGFPSFTGDVPFARKRILVQGAVQGIGFRPFVYRLARELELAGQVCNSPEGVVIDAEGNPANLKRLLERLDTERPPLCRIDRVVTVDLFPAGFSEFVIGPSDPEGDKVTCVLPDIAVCEECLREMRDPKDRRYRYPFTNCTHCGPRFSIVESLPYDRPNTSMKRFSMCAQCRDEYEDPANRRFHAQPIACPRCGPRLMLWDASGNERAAHHEAVQAAAAWIRDGRIVAVKGLGGFHLVVDARNAGAIDTLRRRKHREEKPFALMYPNLESVRGDCQVSQLESELLLSPEAPIVLLRRRNDSRHVADNVAPTSPTLGAMLPYTPLHHLLLEELGFPIVATSGNLSEEPICIDETEALVRLKGIADGYLVHDRPIVRHVDDSIARVVGGREMVLRRARGYAPLPIIYGGDGPAVTAFGGHLKNTVAVSKGSRVFLSQHIGDLETTRAFEAFVRASTDLETLYDASPVCVACDLHDDYLSTKHAPSRLLPVVRVQHHYAHALACMAEHQIEGPVLAVSWDGTGLGADGTIWGGEFLIADRSEFVRAAHLRPFPLPGGEQAVKEPRRSALAILMAVYGNLEEMGFVPTVRAFTGTELRTLRTMVDRNVNAPLTSSAGRLFDAVASIIGICQRTTFEGQAAMALEGLAAQAGNGGRDYEVAIDDDRTQQVLDWAPLIRAVVRDLAAGVSPAQISAGFHGALAKCILHVALRAGLRDVVLTGGCFQNAVLTEGAIASLREHRFQPHWHRFAPPNDGGIALGQAVFASRSVRLKEERKAKACV